MVAGVYPVLLCFTRTGTVVYRYFSGHSLSDSSWIYSGMGPIDYVLDNFHLLVVLRSSSAFLQSLEVPLCLWDVIVCGGA